MDMDMVMVMVMVMDCAGYFYFFAHHGHGLRVQEVYYFMLAMDTTRAGGGRLTRRQGHGCGHGREEVTKFLPAAAR